MRLTLATLLLAATLLPAAARAQSSPVHYEITERTPLVASPSSRARTLAQIDSGTVVAVQWTEEVGPAYTRVAWQGRQGWIVNSAFRRIVTMRDTVHLKVADTVRVTKADTVTRVDSVRRPPRGR